MLTLSRIFEELGDPQSPVDALDRTYMIGGLGPIRYAGALLHETGRLANLAGDTTRTIQAYQRWVKLRAYADDSLDPEIEAVMTELLRLGG